MKETIKQARQRWVAGVARPVNDRGEGELVSGLGFNLNFAQPEAFETVPGAVATYSAGSTFRPSC